MPVRDSDLSRGIAERLANERRARGWSMERLAEEAGVHRTSIGLIERGRRSMTLELADRLAQSLGLRLSALVEDVEQSRSR
ncbi:helix-turn-helix domain-containing protein [Nocardioides anomalus]|nr:helix-turn-helix transcriptional regulator [Nocardioides anomalus]